VKLRQHGAQADAQEISEVRNLEDYDAFVIGSAVYMTHWLKEAAEFLEFIGSTISRSPKMFTIFTCILGETLPSQLIRGSSNRFIHPPPELRYDVYLIERHFKKPQFLMRSKRDSKRDSSAIN
jgi:hypothetical protein